MKTIIAVKTKKDWYVKRVYRAHIKTKAELVGYIKEHGCIIDDLISNEEHIFATEKPLTVDTEK